MFSQKFKAIFRNLSNVVMCRRIAGEKCILIEVPDDLKNMNNFLC